MIVLPKRDLNSDGGKNKKFLFLISRNRMESSPSILITRNLNWSQSLDKGTSYV